MAEQKQSVGQSTSQQSSSSAPVAALHHIHEFCCQNKKKEKIRKKKKIKDRRQERANKETALFGRKQLVCAIIMLSCQASDSETAAVRAPSMHSPHNGPSHGLQQHCHGASFIPRDIQGDVRSLTN